MRSSSRIVALDDRRSIDEDLFIPPQPDPPAGDSSTAFPFPLSNAGAVADLGPHALAVVLPEVSGIDAVPQLDAATPKLAAKSGSFPALPHPETPDAVVSAAPPHAEEVDGLTVGEAAPHPEDADAFIGGEGAPQPEDVDALGEAPPQPEDVDASKVGEAAPHPEEVEVDGLRLEGDAAPHPLPLTVVLKPWFEGLAAPHPPPVAAAGAVGELPPQAETARGPVGGDLYMGFEKMVTKYTEWYG